jgi:spore germination protein YaaH
MQMRIVSDRIMKHGFEFQYKTKWWPFWRYTDSLENRTVVYLSDLEKIIKQITILNK